MVETRVAALCDHLRGVFGRNPVALKWMKRLDHSAIFVLIAGSYTPFALLAMPPRTRVEVLAIVWTGAVVGVALKMWWPSAPRWVGVPLYLLLGWVAICFAGSPVAPCVGNEFASVTMA